MEFESQRIYFLLYHLTVVICWSTFAQVQNIAKSKDTKQSSRHGLWDEEWKWGSNTAVDGDRRPIQQGSSCSHTLNKPGEWWAVNLGQQYSINYIRLFSDNRLSNLTATLFGPLKNTWSDFDSELGIVCYDHATHITLLQFSCIKNVKAEYLQLRTNVDNSLLLCEVEIYPPREVEKIGHHKELFCKHFDRRPISVIQKYGDFVSVQRCAALCVKTQRCTGYQLTPDKICALYQASNKEKKYNSTPVSFYNKC